MKPKKHSLPIILFGSSIIPKYVPFYYRIYILIRKTWRSLKRKLSFPKENEVIPDPDIKEQKRSVSFGTRKTPLINKTFSNIENDLKEDKSRQIIQEINSLKETLNKNYLKFTSAAGSFKEKDFIPKKERYKLWENVWILSNSEINKDDVILDAGGASTIFSFLLANRGCEVHVVDNDYGSHGIVYNTRYVSKRMNWNMKTYSKDLSEKLPFKDNMFDKVFCICVLEHLFSATRKKLMKEINRVLKPGGLAGLTFDYDKNRDTKGFDRGIRYSFKKRLKEDVILPSGLKIYGNEELLDDAPEDFFIGSLFLKK